MDLLEFLKEHGQVLFSGYWCGGADGSPKKRKGRGKEKPLGDALKEFPWLLGALKPCVVLVDYDTPESFERRVEIAKSRDEHCVAIKSQNKGGHVFWFDNNHTVKTANTKNRTLLTFFPVDYKMGYRVAKSSGEITQANSYACLSKDDKSLRELVYHNIREDGTLDEIPFYDLRVDAPEKYDFLNMGEGDGRNDLFHSYMQAVKSSGYTYEQYLDAMQIVNGFLLKDPLQEDEFATVTRREEWDSINDSASWFGKNNRFAHDRFGDMLREQYHVKKINGQLHMFKNGVYVPGYTEIEKAIAYEIPALTSHQRNEVLKYLDVICDDVKMGNLNLIPFRNGVYNLETDTLEPFSPEYIITNQIPWNYNPDAKSDLVDDLLDKLACGDEKIRCLLEEVAGSCLYRSAKIGGGMAAVLLGDKHNGKSTYIAMVQAMLGEGNYSAVDLRSLGDRFSTIMLYGKLANLGDDISGEYIADTSVFKKVTTGESVKAEEKGKPAFIFNPYVMQIYSANTIPRMCDKTGAVLRRLLLVPMEAKFTPDMPGFDPFIINELVKPEHMEYFIQCALDGLADVLKNRTYTIPEKVQQEKDSYNIENNPVLAFIEETGEENIINEQTDDVFRQYQVFCIESGFQPGSKVTFSKGINRALGTESKVFKINKKSVKIFKKVTV
ncbi:MAG: phage/plasmid primase, P4 family [Eubacteriales bacterium]|nr:phage/plasmid primase, P4 family [Eubacteriales bacterium]